MIGLWLLMIRHQLQPYILITVKHLTLCAIVNCKLLYKLSVYGISGNLLAWIQDFLHERSQVTHVGVSYWKAVYLNSGMVQGSCLGPLLYLGFY